MMTACAFSGQRLLFPRKAVLVSDWLKCVAILAHPCSHQYATSIMRAAVVITGASRGFGRCLALDFVRETESQAIDVVRIYGEQVWLLERRELIHGGVLVVAFVGSR